MKIIGEVADIYRNAVLGCDMVQIALSPGMLSDELAALKGERCDIGIERHRKNRSKDANAYMWACIGMIADKLTADKWSIYLEMLKRYGKFTHIVIRKEAYESFVKSWRECEIVSEKEIKGEWWLGVNAYYGSHLYNTKEFSSLLDGIISEVKELGLTPPPTEDIKRFM